MSWVITRHLFGDHTTCNSIAKFSKFSSKECTLRKKLAHEALRSNKHDKTNTFPILIDKLDEYVSCKMVWRKKIIPYQYQQLQILGENSTMDTLLRNMSRVKIWNSVTEYYNALGQHLSIKIMLKLLPKYNYYELKNYESRHVVEEFINKHKFYKKINKKMIYFSSVSLVKHVRQTALKIDRQFRKDYLLARTF